MVLLPWKVLTSNSVRLGLAVRRSRLCVQMLHNLDLLFTIKTVELKICLNICGQIMAISISLFSQTLNQHATSERETKNPLRCGKGIELKVNCKLVVCSCYVSATAPAQENLEQISISFTSFHTGTQKATDWPNTRVI